MIFYSKFNLHKSTNMSVGKHVPVHFNVSNGNLIYQITNLIINTMILILLLRIILIANDCCHCYLHRNMNTEYQ